MEKEFNTYENLDREIEGFVVGEQMQSLDACVCWRRLKSRLPLMALGARVALVVSASEIASERMFS